MTQTWAIALVLASGILSGLYPIFLKRATTTFSFHPIKILKNKQLLIGVTVFFLGFIPYVIALRGGDLSVLYPLSSTGYVWATIFSRTLLGEKMNTRKTIGLCLIIIGVTTLGLAR
jgi:multidrug transporter EmrE-like cation transporter